MRIIVSIIIFHLNKLWKTKFFILWDTSSEAAEEFKINPALGSKRVKYWLSSQVRVRGQNKLETRPLSFLGNRNFPARFPDSFVWSHQQFRTYLFSWDISGLRLPEKKMAMPLSARWALDLHWRQRTFSICAESAWWWSWWGSKHRCCTKSSPRKWRTRRRKVAQCSSPSGPFLSRSCPKGFTALSRDIGHVHTWCPSTSAWAPAQNGAVFRHRVPNYKHPL